MSIDVSVLAVDDLSRVYSCLSPKLTGTQGKVHHVDVRWRKMEELWQNWRTLKLCFCTQISKQVSFSCPYWSSCFCCQITYEPWSSSLSVKVGFSVILHFACANWVQIRQITWSGLTGHFDMPNYFVICLVGTFRSWTSDLVQESGPAWALVLKVSSKVKVKDGSRLIWRFAFTPRWLLQILKLIKNHHGRMLVVWYPSDSLFILRAITSTYLPDSAAERIIGWMSEQL